MRTPALTFQQHRRRALVLVAFLVAAFGASTIAGIVLLARDHRSLAAIAQWATLSLVLASFAVWSAILYGRLLLGELSARRQRQDALDKLGPAEALFRDLAERAIVGVYVVQDRLFQYVNPELARMFGYEPDELIGTVESSALVHPDDRGLLRENVRKWIGGQVPALQLEFRGVKKSGETISVELFGSRTVYRSELAIIGTILDVTERKRLAEERIRMQKLESLGVLAGGIAHDFNNLLAVVMSDVSIAKEHAAPGTVLREVLDEAEAATVRTRDLTGQLLTFSRGGEPIRKNLALGPLLRAAASFAIRGSRVTCAYDVPGDLWPIEADEGQLTQVVQNMVLNAVQAMPEGGIVRIRAANLSSDAASAAGLDIGRCVRVAVSDTGPGVPPDIAHRVFDPYFTTKSSGSGLGLASAHSIITRHRGRIGVEPRAAAGATFYFALPANGGADAALAPRARAPVPQRGTIAVLDDDELVRRSAARALRHLGFEVVVACDGQELLELCAHRRRSGRRIDVALLDLTIPNGMGGMEAAALLREREPYVKVIVSSGYSSDPVMAEHEKYGFSGVVAKPYRIEELRAALGALVGCGREEGASLIPFPVARRLA